jgi:nucleoside-diphosphate-sugar epimerase
MNSEAANHFPQSINDEDALDQLLTQPSQELVGFIKSVRSPLVILGAGGKMGPTLAVLALRAAKVADHNLDVIAISRFSNQLAQRWLEERGVKTYSCDLFDESSVHKLPTADDVLYLVGQKFGTSQNPAATWAANTIIPARIAERYATSRIVALSTGNVYPLSAVSDGGSIESGPLTPLGEYANAAVARERVFEFLSQRNGTPIALLRLFYAVELRYGVLRDLADRIWSGQTVDLANSHFNCIWQTDANEMAIRALELAGSPASAFNLTSAKVFRVGEVAQRLAELLGKPVGFTGVENATALIGNTTKLRTPLGDPATPLEAMLRWTADWVKRGGRSFGKPTHFEVRDGRY